MDINCVLEMSEEEKELLKEILSCDDAGLVIKVNKFSQAASEEYLRMFLGQKIFTRGLDMKEYRLYLLIKYFFDGKIPDEQTITTLFQTTSSESKSLLKSVLAKYQYDLKTYIKGTITNILENEIQFIEGDENPYHVSNISLNIVDEMNKILSTIDGTLSQVSKKRGILQTFEMKTSSYNALRTHYGLEEV